jgi:hypothetical protein
MCSGGAVRGGFDATRARPGCQAEGLCYRFAQIERRSVCTLDTHALYDGDNLDILRRFIPAESVDLVYLDPPFNSN